MDSILEPSTPVRQTDVHNPVTPQMDTVSSYVEGTPFDKSDISPPYTVQSISPRMLEPRGFAVQVVDHADVNMDDGYASSGSSHSSVDQTSTDTTFTTDLDNTNTLSEAQLSRIRLEWMGTSQILNEQNIQMQLEGLLPEVIACLTHDLETLQSKPYDPVAYIEIATSLNRIGFTDIGAGYANRALILVRAGLGTEKVACIPRLKKKVIRAMEIRLRISSPAIIKDELNGSYLEAWLALLDGMMGCSAYWDGLLLVKEALVHFPGHPDLLDMQDVLKDAFMSHTRFLKEQGLDNAEAKDLSRVGKVLNKQYPWLSKDLFYRTPALLREINRNFGMGNCEVRPVVFGAKDEAKEARKIGEGEDVGSCGVFATRDIKAGKPVMFDKTVVGVSGVLPSTFRHCDACHGCIFPPYCLLPVIPACCKKVAYCSASCAKIAMGGYHKALCGKNSEYAYQMAGTHHVIWRSILFQRAAAVVIGDRVNGKYKGHPLQHPFMARLSASYFTPKAGEVQPRTPQDFHYKEYVVGPTKILLELGIDVFAQTQKWSPEVLRTMIMRLDNNANQANITVESEGHKAKPLRTINVNPQYIFFNHSCHPNIEWGSDQPFHGKSIEENGEIHRPAESTVFCNALQDVKEGEELSISYVGDPLGLRYDEKAAMEEERDVINMNRVENRAWMTKWFDNGCGCITCEKENDDRKELEERVARELAALKDVESGVGAMDLSEDAAGVKLQDNGDSDAMDLSDMLD